MLFMEDALTLLFPKKSIWSKEGHNARNETYVNGDVRLADISAPIQ
jgi:hypothetical protein